MNIYFATWMEDNQGSTLTKVKIKNRLISYFFLREININNIAEYVNTGKINHGEQREA